MRAATRATQRSSKTSPCILPHLGASNCTNGGASPSPATPFLLKHSSERLGTRRHPVSTKRAWILSRRGPVICNWQELASSFNRPGRSEPELCNRFVRQAKRSIHRILISAISHRINLTNVLGPTVRVCTCIENTTNTQRTCTRQGATQIFFLPYVTCFRRSTVTRSSEQRTLENKM